jgi:hypothetical protein
MERPVENGHQEPPTPEELAHWRDLSDKATRGPWAWNEERWNALLKRKNSPHKYIYALQGPPRCPAEWADQWDYRTIMKLQWYSVKGSMLLDGSPPPADRAFIAEARTALPRCLDYIDQLHQQIAALKEDGSDV